MHTNDASVRWLALDKAVKWELIPRGDQEALKALASAALAAMLEAVGEPMGWVKLDGKGGWLIHSPYKTPQTETPLYSLAALEQD